MTAAGTTIPRKTTREPSDAILFERFVQGDDPAFVELFDRYDRRLRLYCTKVVGDTAIAEDIVQAIWERIIKMRLEPVAIEHPDRYLMRMARNACLKHLQRRKPSTPIDQLYESEHPSETIAEPSHLEELVRQAIDRLPEEQREALVLHNYCGYSYDDIGAMRGESGSAVKMRAHRARARLARMISAYLAVEKEGEIRPFTDATHSTLKEKKS